MKLDYVRNEIVRMSTEIEPQVGRRDSTAHKRRQARMVSRARCWWSR
jgi:hypothetical protein